MSDEERRTGSAEQDKIETAIVDNSNMEEANPAINVNEEKKRVSESEAMAALAAQLQTAQQKQQENYNLYLRALADCENLKKRSEKEKEEYISFANVNIIKRILPIIDNLERALASASEHADDFDSLHQGLEMVSQSLQDLLAAEGVKAIECMGETFDPRYHQPLMVESNPNYPADTVIEELEKGYTLKNRVIRASLVKVSQ